MKNNNEKSKKQLLEELSKLQERTKNLEKLKNTIIKIQEYLAASEEKFRSFIGFSSDGIALADETGKIIEWNISMTRITGIQPENVFGSFIWEIFFKISEKEIYQLEKQEIVISKTQEILKTGISSFLNRVIDQEILKPDGTTAFTQVSIFSIKTDKGFMLGLVVRDITEIKKAENELKDLNIHLEQRVKEELKKLEQQHQLLIQKSKLESLGKLAAGIAHEINQPLGGISMGLDNILFKLSQDKLTDEYLKRKCDSLFENIARIRHIIDHVRIFSRDQQKVILEKVSVNEVIKNALLIVQTQYQNQEVKIHLNLEENIGFSKLNKYKFEQVILNLLSNAKFAVEKKMETSETEGYQKKIKIRSFSQENKIIIEIEDNGIGISEDGINNIFDPFYTTKEAKEGTGLGLSITYGIIKEMKGEIEVESELNNFTIMRIILQRFPHNAEVK